MAPTVVLRVWIPAAVLALLGLFLPSTTHASAAQSCDVTIAAGNSIQGAIDNAEPEDTICLDAGHYTETLTIDKHLTLAGAGGSEAGSIIQAAGSAGVEDAGRVVLVTGAGVEVTIRGVLIRHGVAEVGAGVAIEGAHVRIEDSTVTDNLSPTWGGGIGFIGGGTLDLIRSTVSNNSSDTDGAGIDAYEADEVSLIESTLSGNTSGNDNGGGIWIGDDGTVVRVERSTISGNAGGGIRWSVFEDTPGLTVVNSTISGNTNRPGINHTGGPDGIGDLTVVNTTITQNAEPVAWLADANVSNTIVTDGCSTELTNSGGHNLEAGTDTCGFGGAGDLAGAGAEADLGPLGDNGGATFTHALGDGSDAAGAGSPAVCADAPVGGEDQRGTLRKADACSIGAFEVECMFNPAAAPATAGVNRGTVSGCRLADLAATSVWVMVDGVLVRYTPGAPAWANAAVVGLYADDVIPAGTTVVLEW